MDLVRKSFDYEVKQIDGGRVLQFIGSNASKDRDGDTIDVLGWELDNYLKNPVFLWAHNYGHPPVGQALKVEKTATGLVFDIKFASRDEFEFADTIYKLYLGKYLRATSVGFKGLERDAMYDENDNYMGTHFKRQELWELSAVPVPANPEALMLAAQKGVITRSEGIRLLEYQGKILKLRPERRVKLAN